MPSRALMVVLLGLLVLATACGGSRTNGYRSKVDAIQGRFRAQLGPLQRQLATAISNRRPKAGAAAARQSSSLTSELRQQIAALAPPAALAPRSSKLVTAYGELVHDLDQLATALDARAPTQANVAIASYNSARLDVSSAIAALNAD